MGEESVDLRKEIAQAKEQINSPDDALADIAIKLQETELQSKLLKVQIEQATLEKENLRIERLRRNNERRPVIFCGVAVVIVLMYLGKLFKSTLNNRLHRNLACVIDKSSRSAKLKRAFEELP